MADFKNQDICITLSVCAKQTIIIIPIIYYIEDMSNGFFG